MSAIFTSGRFSAFTDTGAPLVGGRLYSYASGTTAFKSAYQDAAASIECSYAPDTLGGLFIPLNARGETAVFLGAGAYRFVLKTAAGVTIWTVDGITSTVPGGGASGDVGGLTLLVGDGSSDKSALIAAANAAKLPVLVRGILHIAAVSTLTVPIVDTTAQLFTTTSQITIDNGLPVRPEWWGSGENTLHLACEALPQPKGGVVQLRVARYKRSNHYYGYGTDSGKAMTRIGIKIVGERMPVYANDCKSLEHGSIIEGQFAAYADDFEMSNVGIDNGLTYGGGADASTGGGLFVSAYNNQLANVTVNASVRGLKLHNVIALCASPAVTAHAIIIAGVRGVKLTGRISGMYAVHGVAILAQDVAFDSLEAYANQDDGVIIKSGPMLYTHSRNVRGQDIFITTGGPEGAAPYVVASGAGGGGLKFHAADAALDSIHINRVTSMGHQNAALYKVDGNWAVSNTRIDIFIADSNSGGTVNFDFTGAPDPTKCGLTRCSIGNVEAGNAPWAINFNHYNLGIGYSYNHFSVGRLYAVGMTYSTVLSAHSSYFSIDEIVTENCASVYRILDQPRFQVWSLRQFNPGGVTYSLADGGMGPTLLNGWTQLGGSGTYLDVRMQGGQSRVRGSVKPGSSNVVGTVPFFMRPTEDVILEGRGLSGSTVARCTIKVGADGFVTVNPDIGGTANCSTSLSLDGLSWDL